MYCVEHEYLPMVGCRLDRFVRKKDDLYTFRCPYCGDSAKNKSKTRGYFYSKKNELLFKCHNCGVGRTFANFLKDNFPDLNLFAFTEAVADAKSKSGVMGGI